MALQSTRYDVPPLAAEVGPRASSAGRSRVPRLRLRPSCTLSLMIKRFAHVAQ
jgi:hypothetical protein